MEDEGKSGPDTRIQSVLVNIPDERMRPLVVDSGRIHRFDQRTLRGQLGCNGVRTQLGWWIEPKFTLWCFPVWLIDARSALNN